MRVFPFLGSLGRSTEVSRTAVKADSGCSKQRVGDTSQNSLPSWTKLQTRKKKEEEAETKKNPNTQTPNAIKRPQAKKQTSRQADKQTSRQADKQRSKATKKQSSKAAKKQTPAMVRRPSFFLYVQELLFLRVDHPLPCFLSLFSLVSFCRRSDNSIAHWI